MKKDSLEKKESEKVKDKKSSKEKPKEIKENREEISKLEKDVKNINIDKDKFRDVFVNINDNSPSLVQVAVAAKTNVRLETNLAEVSVNKDDKEIKYNVINYDGKKEKSYIEKQEVKSENLLVSQNILNATSNPRDFSSRDKFSFSVNPEIEGTKTPQEGYINFDMPDEDFTKRNTSDPFQEKKKDKFYEFR